LAITADIDSYVFMAGTQVSMSFSAVMGSEPYQWTFLRLPTELTGTLDGSLSGFFEEEGYFSFGVAVGDRQGRFAYCFITLNIQPLTFFTQWAPQALRSIYDVRVKDYYSISASQQAWKNYYSAAQLLSTATSNATDAQNALKEAQKNMAKMNYTLDLAKQYLQASELQLALASLRKTQAEKIFKKTTADLAVVTRMLAVRQSAFAFAQYRSNQSLKRLQDMQSICLKLSQLLQKASAELTQAQNNLTNAASELQDAQLAFNDSQDSVSNSQSAKDVASQQFQTATVSSEKVFGDAEKAKGDVNVTKQAAAKAMDAFTLANVTAMAALKTLSDANDNVSSLTKAANSAKNDLGQANMRFALALNQLYVAVAAKEQADKAMAFVSSQLTDSNSPQNGTIFDQKSSSFLGCSQGAFPSSFGSG
jgi:predicted  nucleic acid-binding Zn-ribbon protein